MNAINAGIAYFGQWKVTDDDLGLEIILPGDSPFDLGNLHRHRMLGVGPEIKLPLASKKKLYGNLTLRYYWDFAVESNEESRSFIFNLYVDPKEEYPLTSESLGHLWVRWPAGQILTDHLASLKEEPPVPPGTEDPYSP